MAKQAYLTVGDGNFSFSLSLLTNQVHPSLQLVATSFETEDQVVKCPHARYNREQLLEKGAIVFQSIDGTNLNNTEPLIKLGLKYDKIIFNFPHTGGKSQIKKNRQLIQDFFKSALMHLSPTGQVDVALCKGQGGTPSDCQIRGYQNSWKIVEMAAEAGIVLTSVEPFCLEEYPDYMPTGYRGLSKGFLLAGALVHTFKFPGVTKSLFPPVYHHDISFWCSLKDFDESKLISVVKQVTKDCVQSFDCIDEYRPVDSSDRVSYCYRLNYCSLTGVLSRTHARDLQLLVRQTLQQQLGLDLR